MAKNQLPIIDVNWTPQKGGLQSDVALKNIQGGNLYTDEPESGALNIRSVGKGSGVTPGYEPVTGNEKISTLDVAVVQRKEFLITIDLGTVSSVNSDMDFDITTPSGAVLYHISSTVIIPPDADTCATQLITDINATASSLNPVMVKTVVSGTQATISLYFNINTGYDFGLDNMVGAGGIDLTYIVTQDAISIGQLGNWHLIGSCNETGDSFEFWTTKKGDTVENPVTGTSNNGGEVQILSVAHGLLTGEVVSIANVLGTTEANGTWMITVIDADNFTLDLSVYANAYISGGTVYSKVVGLGEIGVVYQTGAESDTYVRLLRSPQLNFSTVHQIDARSKQKQDGNIGVYFVDDNLPYRVFYYKGAYVTDGAISAINPDGQYEYGTIAESLLLFVNNTGFSVDWIDQLQTGGAVRSGNWRYACRLLTDNYSPTEWSQLTNIVSVFSSSVDGNPYTLLGDEPNAVTPKINVLQITNNVPDIFEFVEIAAINYVGNAIQGYIIGRYVLTQEPLQEINHTGNENNVVDLDIGEVGRITAAIKTGRNVELLDSRLVISNLTPQQVVDFTTLVEEITWSVERDTVDPIGIWEAAITTPLNIAEYQQPINIYSKMSHMMYEQYRYGFRFRMKETGAWTPVFYPGYDVRIDLDSAQDGRVAGSFTSFDLTDGVTGAPTEVYTFYINWQNINLGTLVDGTEAYKLIDEIQVCRAEVIPEVLASGAVALGVSGTMDHPDPDGGVGGLMTMGYYPTTSTIVGPFYFFGGVLNLTFTPVSNPTYPQQTIGAPYNNPVRDSLFFYSPDISFGLNQVTYRAGDQIISFGSDFRHDIQQAILPNVKYPYSYAEFSGNSGIVANPTGIDILESITAAAGQKNIVLDGKTHALMVEFVLTGSLGTFTQEILTDNCIVVAASANVANTGGTDYGFYRAIYFRPQQNKYGDPSATTYVYFDKPYEIGTQTGIIASGDVVSYGDVFNQKTYLKVRTPGFFDTDLSPGINLGFGEGIGYYTQNRNNIQLRQKPDTAFSASLVIPNYPLEAWLTFGLNVSPSPYVNARDSQFFYNNGYTPKAGIISAKGFDTTFNYQTDWGNAVMWSNPETDGSNTDKLRLFSPLDIKFLDFTQGEITDARAVNGELITLQRRVILRQYFNTTETQTTNNGSEIILGDGGVLTRKAQTLTAFGCQHKWSVVKGKSDKGFDVLYWVDWENKTVCRFGYNGTDAIDEINGMKSFFANNLTFLFGKDNPANGEGICSVSNQRYREVMWTFRAHKELPYWEDNDSNFSVLKSLNGTTEGQNIFDGMVEVSGVFYGVTLYGGTTNVGVLFSFVPLTNTYTVLRNFANATGQNPSSSLFLASDGLLYGTTSQGGTNGDGVIFSYNTGTNTYTVEHNFLAANGEAPESPVIEISGVLYGTTRFGGTNSVGVIYSYNIGTNTFTKLYDFISASGEQPVSELFAVGTVLYGTTLLGGVNGLGVIYTYNTGTSTYTKIYDFASATGSIPRGGFTSVSGLLYGTTVFGGVNNGGVIYSFNIGTATYSVVHEFDSPTGANPYATLTLSGSTLYGTCRTGGGNNYGVVFMFDPSTPIKTVLHEFNLTDGSFPEATLLLSGGILYGATTNGGSGSSGAIFSLQYIASNYIAGDVVLFDSNSVFEQTPDVYIALTDNSGVQPNTDSAIWEFMPHTDSNYYNEYTAVFSETKDAWQAFHTPKPLIYAPYKNGYLVPRPVGDTGQIYKANQGTWTKWFEDGTGSQSGYAYFDATINQPDGRKQFDNVRVESDVAPNRMEVTTPTGISYTPSGEFVQREGNEFDAPVMNDSTVTGFSNGRTSSMFGDYMIVRLIINPVTYNLINSFRMKLRMLARMSNR